MPFDVNNSFLWEEMKWPEIEAKLKVTDTAILPCGAIEQHGPHLPVDVDLYDAVYMAREIAARCKLPKPFVLPPLPYGVSYHHSAFKGTLSVTNNALSALVYDIGMSLAHNGIRKIILLNGHGDNKPTLTYAAQMINRDAKIFVCVETGETSDDHTGSRKLATGNSLGLDGGPECGQKPRGRHSDHGEQGRDDQHRNDRVNDDIRRQPDAADPHRQGERPEHNRDHSESHEV